MAGHSKWANIRLRKGAQDAKRGKVMSVTNWYTKLQHLLFKLLPDPILTRLWLGMLKKNEGKAGEGGN